MEFNSDKCEVLRITRKRNPVIFPYKLHNKELNVTNAAKYLGVTISKDLNWTPHINNITGKAKNTLRFIKRNIKTSNTKVKEMAYNTYVRPQLEYCSTIWNPWQKTLSQKIESVQRSAARYVCNNYNYSSTCHGRPPLVQRKSGPSWQVAPRDRERTYAPLRQIKHTHQIAYISQQIHNIIKHSGQLQCCIQNEQC